MSKPARIIAGAVGAIALAAVLAMFVLRGDRVNKTPQEAPEPVAIATPSASAPAAERLLAEKPRPPVSAPLVAGPKQRTHADPDAGKRLDDASLLAKLHDLAASDPPLSLQLAREALARFPDSPNAPEFAWNLTKALVNMGRRAEAEEEARAMVKRYPGNYFSGDVEHHLLNHPPNPK